MSAGLGGDAASEAPRLVHRKVELMRPARYAPLILVVVLTIVTALIGTVLTLRGATSSGLGGGEAAATPALSFVDGDEAPTTAPECRPSLAAPDVEPWSSENVAASEAAWAANSAALTEPFVVGEDGFVFWGDVQNNNFSQALGRRSLSAAELELWSSTLRSVRDQLDEEGIDFYVLVGPAKWDVYPEQLPLWAQELDGSGPLDQLLRAAPDLPIIDVRSALREAKATAPVYSAVNSHWSDFGAWVGWDAASRCIAATDADYAGLAAPALRDVDIIDGGNEFAQWGLEPPVPDWSVPLLKQPLAAVTVAVDGGVTEERTDEQRVLFQETPATVSNDSAPFASTLLLVGDSMAVSLTPWVQQSFATVRQIHHRFDSADTTEHADIVREARASGADVVILEIAQRHLNLPPALD